MTRAELKLIHEHLLGLLQACKDPSQATSLSAQLIELSRHDRELERKDRRPLLPPRGEVIVQS